mmetsp:Transcript_8585/g.19975  ORF Transcript_8585/g.19975 Transcript_8585/m.19975 type:complete len:241 (+) Transcript_8585:3179-3901(+)
MLETVRPPRACVEASTCLRKVHAVAFIGIARILTVLRASVVSLEQVKVARIIFAQAIMRAVVDCFRDAVATFVTISIRRSTVALAIHGTVFQSLGEEIARTIQLFTLAVVGTILYRLPINRSALIHRGWFARTIHVARAVPWAVGMGFTPITLIVRVAHIADAVVCTVGCGLPLQWLANIIVVARAIHRAHVMCFRGVTKSICRTIAGAVRGTVTSQRLPLRRLTNTVVVAFAIHWAGGD